MKKEMIMTVTCFTIILAGCGKSVAPTPQDTTPPAEQQLTPTTESQDLVVKRVSGNQTCDDYLEYWQCAAQESTLLASQFTQEKFDSVLASFRDIPTDQLDESCTNLILAMEEVISENDSSISCVSPLRQHLNSSGATNQ